MKSTLLKPAMTRRWLKTVAFIADPKRLAGNPWTIDQIPLGPSTQLAPTPLFPSFQFLFSQSKPPQNSNM